MRGDGDDVSEDWRMIAHAAGVVAVRHDITVDEAVHVLHFEACLFGLPLSRVARLAVSAPRPDDAVDDAGVDVHMRTGAASER